MILPVEAWMDIRRFAPLRAAGATWTEIAAEAGCDWRTARKYLSPDAPVGPPRASSRAGTQPRLVDPYVEVIDAWLVTEPRRASVIHERLVADYGFSGHYQRIKTTSGRGCLFRSGSVRPVRDQGPGLEGSYVTEVGVLGRWTPHGKVARRTHNLATGLPGPDALDGACPNSGARA